MTAEERAELNEQTARALGVQRHYDREYRWYIGENGIDWFDNELPPEFDSPEIVKALLEFPWRDLSIEPLSDEGSPTGSSWGASIWIGNDPDPYSADSRDRFEALARAVVAAAAAQEPDHAA